MLDMEDDPSWYLESYDELVQQAYIPLTKAPLHLEILHPLSSATSAVDKRIYILLHRLLTQYEFWFNDVVKQVVHHVSEVPLHGKRTLHPRYRCVNKLEIELQRVVAEAEAAMEFTMSSMLGKSSSQADEQDAMGTEETAFEQSDSPAPVTPIPRKGSVLPAVTPASRRDSPFKRDLDDAPGSGSSKKRRGSSTSDDFDDLFSTPPPFSSPTSAAPFLAKVSEAWQLESRSALGNRSAFSRTDTTSSDTSTTTTVSTNSTTSFATTMSTTSGGTVVNPATSIDSATSLLELGGPKQTGWSPAPARPDTERAVRVLPPHSYQRILDKDSVHFAVQWEFERMINRHQTITWSDVHLEDLKRLRGSASDVLPTIEGVIEGIATKRIRREMGKHAVGCVPSENTHRPISKAKARLHAEIDREEESIRAGDLRGLGMGSGDGWYGGKITFTITVQPVKRISDDCVQLNPIGLRPTKAIMSSSSPFYDPANAVGPLPRAAQDVLPFKMSLQPPEMTGKSYRLARRFGSRRIINFKLKDINSPEAKREVLQLFVGRCFLVFGRTYRAIWAPPGKDSVFCVETTEDAYPLNWERCDPPMPSYHDIMAMYNGLGQKPNQAMAKWAARPQLLFSDSVPGVLVKASAIAYEKDMVSDTASSYEAAFIEQILTDGCGLMSENLARRLRIDTNSPRPSAIQMRLGGSKGVLVLMSHDQEAHYPGKDVVLRDSMIKSLPSAAFADDPSLLIVDVVRYNSLRIGTSLSFEAIVAMNHGGVPIDTFLKRGAQGLEELKTLFDPHPSNVEHEEDVLNRLISACYRQGGVATEQKKRACLDQGLSTKVAGLSFKFDEQEKSGGTTTPTEEDVNLIDQADRYGIDPVSGQFNSIGESLMDALYAGFHPLESRYTGSKLHRLIATLSNSMIRRFKIPIESSLSAFIIPDSQEILKTDELYISFSTDAPIDPKTNLPLTHLSGPVLAFRSPGKLPTDVRKFIAVNPPELSHLKDCVVLSANSALCTRSPASYLSGGDYDGDTVQLFWDPELVEPFTNSPDHFVDTPEGFVEENFDKEVIKVGDFLSKVKNLKTEDEMGNNEETIIVNMQRFLLGGFEDDKVYGSYSEWHGNALYSLGFDHPETIRLARMFCLVLDARKSGLQVRAGVKAADAKRYSGALEWRDFNKEKDHDTSNPTYRQRPNRLGPFVLDSLMNAGIRKRNEILHYFPLELVSPNQADYLALSTCWERVKRAYEATRDVILGAEIAAMEKHVKVCMEIHRLIWDPTFRANISEHYDSRINGAEVEATPSKSKITSPVKSRKTKSDLGNDLIALSLLRNLAEVWRDKLVVADVPLLCGFGGDELLRRMKIGCAAELSTTKSNRILRTGLPFDMDFYTTCALKAEYRGVTRTVLNSTWANTKPCQQRKTAE